MMTENSQSGAFSKTALAVAGTLLSALAPSIAAAQSDERQQLGEIVVTANKRTESISDVGLSITAASGQTLADRGITSATDLGKIVPGLTVQPSPFNTPVYTLRGIGFYETTLSAAPTRSSFPSARPPRAPRSTSSGSRC